MAAATRSRSPSPILERTKSTYPANRKLYKSVGELDLDSLHMPLEVTETVDRIRKRLLAQDKIDAYGQIILPSDLDRKVTKLVKKANRDIHYNAFWSIKEVGFASLTQQDVDALGSTIEGIRREYEKYKKEHHGKSKD